MENWIEKRYKSLLNYILLDGEKVIDRTGTGTKQVFGANLYHDMRDGFPLLTTKKVFFRGVVEELLWFLRGSTNVYELQEKGVHIWDANYEQYAKKMKELYNVDPQGDLGPIYGKQWRDWRFMGGMAYIDQIDSLVHSLKNNPNSRRHIVSAWNVADIDKMALPPCHCFFQCHVRDKKYLDLQLCQRSADMFLGVPFNIASYALLMMLLANRVGLQPGIFHHVFGNAHIYLNHIEQVKEQLNRDTRHLPTLTIDYKDRWEDYTFEDFHLEGYEPWPSIKAEVSV